MAGLLRLWSVGWPATMRPSATICHHLPPSATICHHLRSSYSYVTMRPTQGSTLAWASTCRSDTHGRPVAGHANFGPNRISTEPADLAKQVATAIHEIAHALGFSQGKFADFRDKTTGQQLGLSNVLGSFPRNGKSVTMLVTDSVRAKARLHFGCSSL